jgi:hypothetical protein
MVTACWTISANWRLRQYFHRRRVSFPPNSVQNGPSLAERKREMLNKFDPTG